MGPPLKILRPVVTTGVFMTEILGSYASPKPLPFLGALCIGSFGFGPKATLRNRQPQLLVPSRFPS